MAGKDGSAFGGYQYISRMIGVTPERVRQQVQALVNWGLIIKQNRHDDHGWFTSNQYGLVDPFAPLNAVAVVTRDHNAKKPFELIRVSKQEVDIPEFDVDGRPPREKPADLRPPVRPLRAEVIPTEQYRKLAESMGLTDPALQAEAWKRFKEALARPRRKKIDRPARFWMGIVRRVIEEYSESARSYATDVEPTEYAKERSKRRNWTLSEACRRLMAGETDTLRIATEIFELPFLFSHTKESACSLEEILGYVEEARRAFTQRPA